MANFYTIKRYMAITVSGALPIIAYQLALLKTDLLIALVAGLGTLVLCIPICSFVLRNPYTDWLEGKGILLNNLDSTGLVLPVNIKVRNDSIFGRIAGQDIEDIFNRETVHQMKDPITAKVKGAEVIVNNKKYFLWALDEEEFNGARHSLVSKPFIIWNNQTKSLVTKDWWSSQEKDLFAEHVLLRVDRRLAEVSLVMKNMSRNVINLALKPQGGLLTKWWFWLIVAVGLGVLMLVVGPIVMKVFQNITGAAGDAIGNSVTPR